MPAPLPAEVHIMQEMPLITEVHPDQTLSAAAGTVEIPHMTVFTEAEDGTRE